MAKYEVTTELIIHCPVKVIVEADSKDAALEAAADLIPGNLHDAMSTGTPWKADIKLKPPKGVAVSKADVRATAIAATSGGEKARKI